jgi:ABC-2 type transport system permease protein
VESGSQTSSGPGGLTRMTEHKFLDLVKLFFKYSHMTLKTPLEYKFDRIFITIAIFCREMISVAIMYLLLTRFIRIKGWELNEMFFLYSFLFLSYSLFVFFFAGIRDFDSMIYWGEFDRFLLRPVGIMFQVIASKVDYSATLGHGLVGLFLFLKTAFSVGIVWNTTNTLYYIVALLGGMVIQASIFMISSCFSFWTIKTENLRNMFFFNARRIAGYPLTFYPGFIQKLLIFLIPFAFVNYFPAQFFLHKQEISMFWNGFFYLTPVVGVVMFLLAYRFWKYGMKQYASVGN